MSDIQPGDVVVCVDAGQRYPGQRKVLHKGRVYRVAAIGVTSKGNPGLDVTDIARVPPLQFPNFRSDRFRKLNDGTDDAELIERIKRCQPTREKADA